jgi:hypothetical protein
VPIVSPAAVPLPSEPASASITPWTSVALYDCGDRTVYELAR